MTIIHQSSQLFLLKEEGDSLLKPSTLPNIRHRQGSKWEMRGAGMDLRTIPLGFIKEFLVSSPLAIRGSGGAS